ncbi:sulfur oxidation c-type cytochrome SoxX [Bosea thiooxidans]|uniref:Sulfur oxidation c-type cytochrome SoxX n=1 Tax=Bosea thiooxidans TaxID=53254 RepID=A0A0Q3L087_9HYPH|nr:sulfur oxidation c-type cytochrome SoxX [Bosea thiooxidans]KQK30052.1 sulfur oxidation c-type cytochrome SoxX [Bosea thiooxidans]SKB50432.1 sulfur-oxidizing protein SoxX [Bosea thiooxidans]
MIKSLASLAFALLAAGAASAQDRPAQATIDAYLKSTFGKASAEWQARIKPDDSLAVCNATRNQPSSAQTDEILKREAARVVYPADGKFLGDWKKGYKVANNGRGGQFSDPPGTVSGGNCFACHQLDPKEVSYGTLGPSLAAYGKDRKYDPETIKEAYTKVYNSMAVVPCSNMPRFGVNKVLDEEQIKDVMAYLFDPESPVNK